MFEPVFGIDNRLTVDCVIMTLNLFALLSLLCLKLE